MTAKKNFSYLAMLLCAVLVVSTIGNSFGIRNSFAQQEVQTPTRLPFTINHSPQSNNSPFFNSGNLQSGNMEAGNSDFTRHSFGNESITVGPNLFTNNKNFNLVHSFVSNKVVGPDRFRFVTSYWTLPDTSLGVDVGTSANNKFLAAQALPPNTKLEVDTNEGFSTLAVVLQYEGVVNLAGITAALKLPTGFKAIFPLIDDRNNFDIALSSYRGHIYPGQGIVLYFSVNVLPTAKIVQIPQLAKTSNATGLPELGPLALHFLKTDERSTLDLLDASQQNMFAKTLSVMHTANGTLPNSTFNDIFDLKRHYLNQFGRFIPYGFVNQVIPVILAVTGQETLDIVTLPPGKFCNESCNVTAINATTQFSNQILKIPSGVATKLRLAIRNTGDVGFWYLGANVDNNATNLQSTLGINGLNPSAITSPNIPQTLFSTILPLGIVGREDFGATFTTDYLPPNSYVEFDPTVFPTHYAAGTVQLLNVQITGTNVIGEPVTENRQVYIAVAPP
jgi:hypothetical protein